VCLAGLALFLLALLQGFFIPLFERVDAARAAHATALASGTFLIVVGLLWPKLRFRRGSATWAALLATSLYAIATGLTLGAAYPAGAQEAHRVAAALTMILNTGGAIVLVVSVSAVLVACKTGRTARDA
jgi:hydroxylaminobenzene mutase